jgi:hypothetical protein
MSAADSAEYAALKRGFQFMLDRVGVPIVNLGNDVSKKCVAGPVDRKLAQKLHQSLEDLVTGADMFTTDFEAMAFELNKTAVTLNGAQLVIVAASADDADPVTHMLFRADY